MIEPTAATRIPSRPASRPPQRVSLEFLSSPLLPPSAGPRRLLQAISEHAALDVLLPLLLVVTDHDEQFLFCRAEHVQPFQLGRQSVLVFLDPSRIFAANQANPVHVPCHVA